MTSLAGTTSAPEFIDSVQVTDDNAPRFRIPARYEHPEWADAAAVEAAGGVAAEVRVFFDEQITTGDVLLDLAPGFGFVALSAATAPNGVATVFVAGFAEPHLTELQNAAADAGAWVEGLSDNPWSELDTIVDTRLETEGRIFAHVAPSELSHACAALSHLIASNRLLALCVSAPIEPGQWTAAREALERAGLRACVLADRDGSVMLMPVRDVPASCLIAVPADLFEDTSHAVDAHTVDAHTVEAHTVDALETEAHSDVYGDAAILHAGWNPGHDGLSLIAPHSRTGYGVAGANLLRALQARGVPVAFFPIGGVDRTLTDNPALDRAIEAQGTFRGDVPSVRLSQQFDLALHAGRGPRIGFTIFETDAFTARELHHLRAQDAILVCSAWARDVCYANGLTDRPVHVVPLGVDRAVFHEHVMPARQWNETVFLQAGKLEPRKGQLELLRAFEAAFTPNDDVRLILACHNPFMRRDLFDAALAPFRTSPMAKRITIVDRELETSRDVAALMATAHCGVFPARAEGWNLEALEMLSMGKTVIATNATAHTEYLTPRNARLIGMDALEPAMGGRMAGRWSAWGTSQHEQLVAHLRAVQADRMSGQLVENRAGITTANTYSWDASAQALLDALAHIA